MEDVCEEQQQQLQSYRVEVQVLLVHAAMLRLSPTPDPAPDTDSAPLSSLCSVMVFLETLHHLKTSWLAGWLGGRGPSHRCPLLSADQYWQLLSV